MSIICNNDVFNQIQSLLKQKNLKFYQFYNTEIETDEYSFIKYMTTFKDSKKSKILNKTYYDIEIYGDGDEAPDSETVPYPINSVALYNNVLNEAYILCTPYGTNLTPKCNITDPVLLLEGVKAQYNEIVKSNETYNVLGMTIKLFAFKTEEELLIKQFELLKNLNTLMLTGFNSSLFDDPYCINRGIKLMGENKFFGIVSDFHVNKYGARTYEWPDYQLVDLLELYKPVDAGGSGFGKSLPSYKLDAIAHKELGINKLELEDNFLKTFEHNIVHFLTYNLLDTILTFKLDEKLKFLELIFSLAKYNDSTMGAAINGRSIMYTYRNDLIYTRLKKVIRNKKFSSEIFFTP